LWSLTPRNAARSAEFFSPLGAGAALLALAGPLPFFFAAGLLAAFFAFFLAAMGRLLEATTLRVHPGGVKPRLSSSLAARGPLPTR